MPRFTPDDVDLSPYEFLDVCTQKEITQVMEWLYETGQIRKVQIKSSSGRHMSISEEIFNEHIEAIIENYYSLTKEDDDTILKIGKKFL